MYVCMYVYIRTTGRRTREDLLRWAEDEDKKEERRERKRLGTPREFHEPGFVYFSAQFLRRFAVSANLRNTFLSFYGGQKSVITITVLLLLYYCYYYYYYYCITIVLLLLLLYYYYYY